MAALIGLAVFLLAAVVQAVPPPPVDEPIASADPGQDGMQGRPQGEEGVTSVPSVRRPPDDSELDSNAIVDFPQDI